MVDINSTKFTEIFYRGILMEGMVIISGIWIVILPKMNWTSMGEKVSLLHFIIGIYICAIGILSKIGYIIPGDIFHIIAFVAVIILEIITIIIKLRKERTIIGLLVVFTGIIALALAILVYVIDTKEIWSSIVMIVGALIMMSISYIKKQI